MPFNSGFVADQGAPDYRQMAALWSALAPLEGLARVSPLPALELRQTADSLVVTARLPGYDPAHVRIQATPHSLTFTGQQPLSAASAYGSLVGLEQFQHTIPLPVAVQEHRLQVIFQEDTIVVTLPRANGWAWRRSPSRPQTVPTLEAWTLGDEVKYQGGRVAKGWRQLRQWLGRQLQKLGTRLSADG